MRYRALACDYDGTIASDGVVKPATLRALERLKASGRKLLLVTGRELDELLGIFPQIGLFERVVAENGALVYTPETQHEYLLHEPPQELFVQTLRERGVGPISVGKVIVATWEPHEVTVLKTIRDLGLELQVIFNKGAVMVLPAGITKATGLTAALHELGLSTRNTVGVGDAENDHAFLSVCECSAAVSNALPAVQERADLVTPSDRGAGVAELIDRLLENDLADMASHLTRHRLTLGHSRSAEGEQPCQVEPYGTCYFFAETCAGEQPTASSRFLERLAAAGYQFCLLASQTCAAYASHDVALGTSDSPPNLDEVDKALQAPDRNVIVELTGIESAGRPAFVLDLLRRLHERRLSSGRPHWIVIDQADEVLGEPFVRALSELTTLNQGMAFISAHPRDVAEGVRNMAGTAFFAPGMTPWTGESPAIGAGAGSRAQQNTASQLGTLVWRPDRNTAPFEICLDDSASRRQPPEVKR